MKAGLAGRPPGRPDPQLPRGRGEGGSLTPGLRTGGDGAIYAGLPVVGGHRDGQARLLPSPS